MRGLLVVLVLVAAACSGSSPKPAVRDEATLTEEAEVSGTYRQGVARVDDGWIFSTNNGLFRVDEELVQVVAAEPALPVELTDRDFDHIGDVDVVGDILYAPVEQGDYGLNTQVMARFDAETLAFVDATDVAQAHNAWVAVDRDAMTAYSMSGFGDSTILRYDIEAGWASLEPLLLDTFGWGVPGSWRRGLGGVSSTRDGCGARCGGRAEQAADLPELVEADRRVVDLIAARVATADELLAELGTDAGLARLGSLELRGPIRSDETGRYTPA